MADLFKNQNVPLKEPYESNTFSKVFSPGISPPYYRPDSRLNQNYVDNQNLNEMESKQSLEDKNFIKQLKSNNELLFKASK